MAHEDAGKYANKHPVGSAPDERIARAIREASPDGKLSCASGERISKALNVGIPQVGLTADLLEMKIKECQLGLFGWGGDRGHGKEVQAADQIPEEVNSALEKAAEGGKIDCKALWTIANQLGVGRKSLSAACEALGLKIRSCQLGTF